MEILAVVIALDGLAITIALFAIVKAIDKLRRSK